MALVINYDISYDFENYVHRVGRCGRFNKSGVVISIINKNDANNLNSIQQKYKFKLDEFTF